MHSGLLEAKHLNKLCLTLAPLPTDTEIKFIKLRGGKAMEQLQFNGVVLEMVRFFKRQVTETHHMII